MRLIKALVTLTLVALTFAVRPSAQSAGAPAVPGEIIVKFRSAANANARADAHRTGRGRQLREIARANVQLVAVADGDEPAAVARYRRNPNVLYAERNFIRRIPEPISHGAGTVMPGDHFFTEQWALHNTGQQFFCIIPGFCLYVGTPDADIDGPEAWAIATGAGVKVAVIDTGVDYTHPDLAPNVVGGYDFVNVDPDPMDDHGHGTHVSGTIAARVNNLTGTPADEEGVVGVAPDAQILAYKVCRFDGTCSDFAIVQAIARAVADGAQVINMSLGGPEFSQALYDAVQDAWNAGLVIVAGAGNDGTAAEFYPAAFDNVVSVGAFDEDHRRATFSNFGTWVDISAPGNVIMSTYPMNTCSAAPTPGDIGCYTWNSGTSMATPHVAGAAALVWSRGGVTTNSQVVDILLGSADPQGVDAIRLDSWTIHGGLNLHNALSFGVTNFLPVANAGDDQTVNDGDGDGSEVVTLNGSASTDADGTIVNYEWREGTLIGTGATATVSFPLGTHTVTLHVTDDDGGTDTDTVVIRVKGPNQLPTANAGADQTVTDTNFNGNEPVTLNGSGSTDPDGTIASYEWREGSVVLGTGATPTALFAIGTHTVTLQVTDDDGATATDTVVVTVNPAPNQPPHANAGLDQTVTDANGDGSDPVMLNGAGSWDPDGSIVSYEWREGSAVIATGRLPLLWFTVGTHTVTLQVTDDDGATATDTVVITVNPAPNQPPVANAGADLTVTDTNGNGNEPVTLNGSASSDPDGTIATYQWREGSTVLGTGATPTIAFAVGTHTVTLVVTDDDGATATDTVVITVNSATGPNQPPVANAGADQTVTDTNGNGNEPVTLNGSASSDPDGTIVSYTWHEGAALIGTGATPSISFAVGTHTVTLTVTDDDGATATDSVVISVNPAPPPNVPPVANAGADQTVTDTNFNGNEPVTLNGSGSTDPDGTIASYEWREGSVVLGTGATPTALFAIGTHTVTLQVTDDDGATATDTVVVTVNPAPNQPPHANAGLDQTVTDANGDGSDPVMLNGAGSWDPDGSIVSYEWREGSAVIATGRLPLLWFTVGTHTVTLQVTDDDGATATDTVVITVNPAPNQPPVANAGADLTVTDTNGNGNEPVTLNGSASSDPDGTIATYQWREGSTVLGTGATPTIAFAVGTHTVTLVVTDDDGATATDTVVITVRPAPGPNQPPTANAGLDQTATDTNGNGNEPVTLNGSGSTDPDGTIASYEWREGSVVLGTGATPTALFAIGTHTVTLQVTDDDGATATDTVVVTVNPAPNQPPHANAGLDQTVTDANGDGSDPVMLNGAGSWDPDGSIVSYEWREGSAVIATGRLPLLWFTVGTHTVTLQVTDDDGATATDTVVITVNPAPNQPPVANAGADLTVTDTNGNGNEPVTLNGSASSDPDGTIATYQWREGSTVLGTGATPTIAFAVGTHTVTLVVTDDDGATATDTVVITVNSATGPNQPPVANAGADQTVTDTNFNGNEPATLNGSGSTDPDGTIASYEWREGSVVLGTGATPIALFAIGTHTVTLQVTDDDGATATDTVVVTVNPAPNQPPHANAGLDQTVTDANGDGSDPVMLNGAGSWDPDGSIVSYEWREGSAVIATGRLPLLWFTVGTHTVTLQVTDDDGATATDTVVITVNPAPNQPPVANAGADLTVTDTNGNGNEPVTLNGSASSDPDGTIATYQWREGSTVLGTGATPTIAFAVGTHTVTLVVTDDDGATATDTVVITVRPAPGPNQPPTANAGLDQTATDTNGNGNEPVTLNGSASSDSDGTIVSYEWREGSTLIGTGVSPTLAFAVGTHSVTLQVTDDDGATATDTVVITVNLPPNQPPVAHAGLDQTVTDAKGDGRDPVMLNGVGSWDADGTIVGYQWREGSTVIATGALPTFWFTVGVHTVTLQVTDDDGATATDTVVITVNPAEAPATVHIGDLDRSTTGNTFSWTARATVTVHNANHQPVSGAVMTGSWTGGILGTCTTNGSGACVVSRSMRRSSSSVTFTVAGIAASGLSYAVGDNHEPDGDSTGTAITILKP